MSWREKLKTDGKIYFRNVPFHYQSTTFSAGKRKVVHQYALKDTPNIEELGDDIIEFSIVGAIVQNNSNSFNYMTERDALISALEKKGSGQLRHPFYGNIEVEVKGRYEVDETFTEMGKAVFTITFMKAGQNKFPTSETDPIEDIDTVAGDHNKKLQEAIANKSTSLIYPTAAIPSPIQNYTDVLNADGITAIEKITNNTREQLNSINNTAVISILEEGRSTAPAVSTISNFFKKALGTIKGFGTNQLTFSQSILGSISTELTDIGEFPNILLNAVIHSTNAFLGILNMVGTSEASLLTPENTLDAIRSNVAQTELAFEGIIPDQNTVGISGAVDAATTSVISALLNVVDNVDIGQTPRTTLLNNQEQLGRRALENQTISTYLIMACRCAVRKNYSSRDDALQLLSEINTKMDAFLDKVGNEEQDTVYNSFGIEVDNTGFYEAISQLQPIINTTLEKIATDLAFIENYKTGYTTTTTLHLAYDKYENINRNKEVEERNINLITHPGFIPEDTDIEVLSE